MNHFDASLGLAGTVAVSIAAYAMLRRTRRSDLRPASRLDSLGEGALGFLGPEPDRLEAQLPRTRPAVGVRRVARDGRSPGARPAAPRPAVEPGPAELLSLIGSMQWDRALSLVARLSAAGRDLGSLASLAEAALLERVRALPEADPRTGLGGYRLLAALCPANPAYAARVAHGLASLEARRGALMTGLTRDEDRTEPGTVWLNHPWNPRFDDVRRPIWPYIGCRPDGRVSLRLRTNWLGDCRISVRGIEVVHDGMAETLTRGAYKIDPDALGWEWRDEAADMYQLEVLRSVAGAGEVVLRYRGDPWPCEATLTEEEKAAVGETLELYDLLALSAPTRLAEAA